jgi:Fur family zinc uptake transcriptional regulator
MPHAFDRHDHASCRASAIAAAEVACEVRGERLTPLRRRTLEILLESHAALGAYDVLARLEAEGFGSKPPVAYRALSFLVENGFAHRIEGLSAYVACARPGSAHDPSFLVCRSCRRVAEEAIAAPLGPEAAAEGFVVERTVVEAQGLCPACRGASA